MSRSWCARSTTACSRGVAGWPGRSAKAPCLGHAALDLPARPGVPARTARLAIRFGRLELPPPRESRKAGAGPVAMTYVDLCEETPPEGVTPVHWRLLTTCPVETVADALDIAGRYARRWKIEELFRTSNRRFAFGETKRKGFDIEALRIGEEAPRNRLILACLLAATVVLQMTAERDGRATGRVLRPLTDAFDPGDRPLLEAVSRSLEGRTERQKNPHPPGSLAFATWVCARLGGWTGYYGQARSHRHPERMERIPVPQARRAPRPPDRQRRGPRCVNPIARGKSGRGDRPGGDDADEVGAVSGVPCRSPIMPSASTFRP